MKLPFLVSVPHAGTSVPWEAKDICVLTPDQILADSDSGAAEIYYELEHSVAAFCSTDIARAIVDLNRSTDDFGKDGVIKTHTCYNVPVYKEPPSQDLIDGLLSRYYHPYHRKLQTLAGNKSVRIGIDCHTMAAVGPPVGPDAGKARPLVCISNADGTCPDEWLDTLAECFLDTFPHEKIRINSPFKGGFIIRNHSAEIPWLQIELSRTESLSDKEKRDGLTEALSSWCRAVF